MDLKLVAPESDRAGPASASSPLRRAMVAATKPPDPGDAGLTYSAKEENYSSHLSVFCKDQTVKDLTAKYKAQARIHQAHRRLHC